MYSGEPTFGWVIHLSTRCSLASIISFLMSRATVVASCPNFSANDVSVLPFVQSNARNTRSRGDRLLRRPLIPASASMISAHHGSDTYFENTSYENPVIFPNFLLFGWHSARTCLSFTASMYHEFRTACFGRQPGRSFVVSTSFNFLCISSNVSNNSTFWARVWYWCLPCKCVSTGLRRPILRQQQKHKNKKFKENVLNKKKRQSQFQRNKVCFVGNCFI